MEWPLIELGRVAKVRGGFGFPREFQGLCDEEYPFFKVGDMNTAGNEVEMRIASNSISEHTLNDLGAKAFPPGTVIFPKIGAAIATEKKRILVTSATFDNNVMGVVPGDPVVPRFLFYWFQTVKLQEVANQGPVPSIRKTAVEQLSLPLPTLSEQRRIVEILDQADHLRHLRTEANTKADHILSVLFMKMFGDPATNPMGWPLEPLGSVVESLEAGWSAKGEARGRQPEELGVLKVSAVTSRTFQPDEHKAVPREQVDRALVTPRRGDLLFSRANTRELVAATCVVEADDPNLFLPDKLWRINLRPDRASSIFLHELLGIPAFRDTLRARATGTSGSMLNVPQDVFLATRAPMPPVELQRRFGDLGWNVLDARAANLSATGQLERLNTVALHRAFSGALTASWREGHRDEVSLEQAEQAKVLREVH